MNKQDKQKCIDTVDSLMVTRGNGGPGDRKKKRVKHGDGRRFSFGQWTCNAIYRCCILKSASWKYFKLETAVFCNILLNWANTLLK